MEKLKALLELLKIEVDRLNKDKSFTLITLDSGLIYKGYLMRLCDCKDVIYSVDKSDQMAGIVSSNPADYIIVLCKSEGDEKKEKSIENENCEAIPVEKIASINGLIVSELIM